MTSTPSFAQFGLLLNYAEDERRVESLRRRTREFTDVIDASEQFTEQFAITFISLQPDQLDAIALVRGQGRVATFQRRLKIVEMVNIEPPIHRTQIEAELGKSRILRLRNLWANGKKAVALDHATWQGITEDYLFANRQDIYETIAQLRELAKTVRTDDDNDIALHEIDAASTAIRLAKVGGQEDILMRAFASGSRLFDFLERPESIVKVREDPMISHDQRLFGDWTRSKDYVTHSSLFTDGKRRVLIHNVNRADLESKLGVDLIYQDIERGRFMMIQYKRLTSDNLDREFKYYPSSDRSLDKEMDAMKRFEAEYPAKDDGTEADYRYNDDLFYFKFCQSLQPLIGQSMCKGFYLTKEQVLRRMIDKDAPKAIAASTLHGYFTSTTFIDLFHSGLIGCRKCTAKEIDTLMLASMDNGKSLLVASLT